MQTPEHITKNESETLSYERLEMIPDFANLLPTPYFHLINKVMLI